MRLFKIALAVVVVLIVAISAGTYAYINYVKDDAPSAFVPVVPAPAGGSTQESLDSEQISGSWAPTSASEVGYRVKEVLFGQPTEGVGRTNAVTGSLTVRGLTIDEAEFSVDMTTLKSDSDRRDNQVRGRILETSEFPTSEFNLTSPITLPAAPSSAGFTVPATGELTLHGVTKAVTVELNVRTVGANVVLTGSIPVRFSDYDIEDPSFGGATVEQNGTLEMSLTFAKQ